LAQRCALLRRGRGVGGDCGGVGDDLCWEADDNTGTLLRSISHESEEIPDFFRFPNTTAQYYDGHDGGISNGELLLKNMLR
jgi:hypothetical protein